MTPPHATTDEGEGALAGAGGGPGLSPAFVASLPGSAVLRLTGSDARSFLHGQLANDVTGLAQNSVGRSLLLNHKGHAMAQAAIIRTADSLLCVVEDERVNWVRETLERHIVFDDVRLEQPAASLITVQGVNAAELLAAIDLSAPQASGVEGDAHYSGAVGGVTVHSASAVGLEGEALYVYPSRRSLAGGFDVLLVGAAADASADALQARLLAVGAAAAGPESLAAARVVAGIASAAGEGGEGVLPQEAGLESLISYRKGCYLGQEIMARIEARGNLRRELALLELAGLPGDESQTNRDIEQDGKRVGLLGTVAELPDGSVRALAVLRREVAVGSELSTAGVSGRRVALAEARDAAPIMPA